MAIAGVKKIRVCMPDDRTDGSSDDGKDYELAVLALLATKFSTNKEIEDYVIYFNIKSANKFDDIVARVKIKGELYLLLIQIKHKDTGNFSVNEKDITDWHNTFKRIIENSDDKLIFREGISDENIRFGFFCNKGLNSRVYRAKLKLVFCSNDEVRKNMTNLDRILMPFECTKLEPFVLNSINSVDFFSNLYLFLNQLDEKDILIYLNKICNSSTKLLKYIKYYFKDEKRHENGISKHQFEMELQICRLREYCHPIMTPDKDAPINLEENQVNIWNEIILKHDVTIVKKVGDMIGYLYRCIAKKIHGLLEIDIDQYFEDKLDMPAIASKFMTWQANLKEEDRYCVKEPENLQALVYEFWKCGKVPLILNTIDLKILNENKHLKRSYIVIRSSEEPNETLSFEMDIFANLNDIKDILLRGKLMDTLSISLQGRKPITLKHLIGDSSEITKAITSADILQMMRSADPVRIGKDIRGSEADACNGIEYRQRYLTMNDEDHRRRKISEKDFLREVKNKVTIVKGEVGSGKSSLLKSLVENYEMPEYIIFYDLIKCEELPVKIDCATKITELSMTKLLETEETQYIHILSALFKEKRLIVILDSYNEVEPSNVNNVLNFLKVVTNEKIQIIIASTSWEAGTLDSLDVTVADVDNLTDEDVQMWNINQDILDNVSTKIKLNPLCLSLMKRITDNNINKYDIYEIITHERIKHYHSKLSKVTAELEDVSIQKHERLALLQLIGEDICRMLWWTHDKCNNPKLLNIGIIASFDDIHPKFNDTNYIDYFAAKWILKNTKDEIMKDIAAKVYQKIMELEKLFTFNIVSESIPIHKAVIQRKIEQVKEFCQTETAVLTICDELGRIPFQIAVICGISCQGGDGYSELLDIITHILEVMHPREYDIGQTDELGTCDWKGYCHTNSSHQLRESIEAVLERLRQ